VAASMTEWTEEQRNNPVDVTACTN